MHMETEASISHSVFEASVNHDIFRGDILTASIVVIEAVQGPKETYAGSNFDKA